MKAKTFVTFALLAFVAAADADAALNALRADPLARHAAIIGEVSDGEPGLELRTALGARRTVRMPLGELLPRIC